MFFMHSKCCWQNSFRRVLLKLKIYWLWAYLWTDLLRKWAIANFSLWYQLQKIFSSFSKYYEWDNHVMWLVLKIFNIPCPSVKNSWYWYIRHGPVQCSGPVAGHHVVVLEVLLLSLSHVSHLVPETTKLFFQKIPITNNLQIKLKTNKSFKAIKLVIANFILNVSPSVSSIYPFHFIYFKN